jgi:hypothetical protein
MKTLTHLGQFAEFLLRHGSDKSCTESKTRVFMFNNFFENHKIMLKKMV